MQELVAAEQLGVGDGGALGDVNEDVEVVGEDGVSDDLDVAEFGDLPDHFAKDLAGRFVKKRFAVYAARHEMVVGIGFTRI
jgi:hypothetical protein